MSEKVAILRCASYDQALVNEQVAAVARLCGFDSRQLSGKKVLLKPNILFAAPPSRAVSTHPSMVRAAAEWALAAGASEVWVGDSPGFGSPRRNLRECGITGALEGLPIKIADFNKAVPLPNPGGAMPEYAVAEEAMQADFIINLPKLKTHTQMVMTCAVKNLFGLVVGFTKGRYHLQAGRDNSLFARYLVELAYLHKPAITFVDAVVAMHGNGPGSGEPFTMGLVMAGTDPMAVDATAARIIGFERSMVPMFAVAAQLNKGMQEPEQIEVLGESVESAKVAGFKPSAGGRGFAAVPAVIMKPLKEWLAIRPVIDPEKCKECLECVKMCPARVMAHQNKRITIDKKGCIRCFCCQEICPEGAIRVDRNRMGRILVKILR